MLFALPHILLWCIGAFAKDCAADSAFGRESMHRLDGRNSGVCMFSWFGSQLICEVMPRIAKQNRSSRQNPRMMNQGLPAVVREMVVYSEIVSIPNWIINFSIFRAEPKPSLCPVV